MSDEKPTTTLEALVGPHMLSGVQPGTRPKTTEWQDSNPNTLTVVFDDVAYMVIENPDDGYRSSMEAIEIADLTEVTNRFQPVAVTARMRDRCVNEWLCDDVLDVTDDATGKIVLSLGTENAEDYYPVFVAHWQPENLILNAAQLATNPQRSPAVTTVGAQRQKTTLAPQRRSTWRNDDQPSDPAIEQAKEALDDAIRAQEVEYGDITGSNTAYHNRKLATWRAVDALIEAVSAQQMAAQIEELKAQPPKATQDAAASAVEIIRRVTQGADLALEITDALMAARTDQSASRLQEVEAERDRYRKALDEIASWGEGETVGAHFDEPGSAQLARDALAAPPSPADPHADLLQRALVVVDAHCEEYPDARPLAEEIRLVLREKP